MEITVRQFKPVEWAIYKAIRLKALQSDAYAYSSTYDETLAKPDTYWHERLANPDNGIFGVFHGQELIGLTGVYIEDRTSGEASVGSSWLKKEWRNKGVSEKMFTARINWARQHPGVKTLIVTHRESNVSSKKAILKQGFLFDHAVNETWPDGKTEPELVYKLEL